MTKEKEDRTAPYHKKPALLYETSGEWLHGGVKDRKMKKGIWGPNPPPPTTTLTRNNEVGPGNTKESGRARGGCLNAETVLGGDAGGKRKAPRKVVKVARKKKKRANRMRMTIKGAQKRRGGGP